MDYVDGDTLDLVSAKNMTEELGKALGSYPSTGSNGAGITWRRTGIWYTLA